MTTEELDRLEERIISVEHSMTPKMRTEGFGAVSVPLAHLKDLIRAARENEQGKRMLRGQMAVTGEVLEDNTERMITALVLADENKALHTDLFCEHERYRQAVALIQVLREENAEKDAQLEVCEKERDRYCDALSDIANDLVDFPMKRARQALKGSDQNGC